MNGTSTIVPREYELEIIDLLKFLTKLSDREKREFFVFIQGVKFAKGITDTDDEPESRIGA